MPRLGGAYGHRYTYVHISPDRQLLKNPVVDPAQQAVGAFFEALRPVEQGYPNDTFAFVAIKHLGVFNLVQARLFRNPDNDPTGARFETDMILAGRFAISELKLSSEEIIRSALLGSVPTPMCELRFPPGEAGRYAFQYEPFHQEGLTKQQRLSILRLDGATTDGYVDVDALGWHLRAAAKPYHDLQDLLFSFGLGFLREQLNIETIAFPVSLVDTTSHISGTKAHVGVRLANSLDPENVTFGYRVLHQGGTIARDSLKGRALSWEQRPGFQLGRSTIEVPATAVVQCFASFNGNAQHFYWIVDSSTSQNPRRTTFEAFDPGLSLLREFLVRQGRGQNARDLEMGVSWLLWLLGFSTATLGGTARTQDFADVIATTSEGHIVVIECTTGLLKADNKLPQLIQRTQLVRARIQSSDNRHLKVLPVLVTSKTREEVRADLDQAERLGVLIVTKEDLDDAPSRTLTMPNADALFREAEETVRTNIEKHRIEQ